MNNPDSSKFPSNRLVLKKALFAYLALIIGKILAPRFSFHSYFPITSLSTFWVQMWLSTLAVRCVYFFSWSLGDALANSTGFGYNPMTDRHDLVTNIDWWAYETAPNARQAINTWNIQTATWLRIIAFDRVPNKTLAGGATFLLSILWHGILPGYWFAFTVFHLSLTVSKGFYKATTGLELKGIRGVMFKVLSVLAVQTAFNYAGVLFNLRHWQPCIEFLTRTYFVVPIFCIIFTVLPLPKMKQKAKKE